MPNFDVGDFVLQATVQESARSKLQDIWKGPAQIVRVISGYVYEVEDLITKRVMEAHVSRLKFYADDKLNVCEQLLSHVAHSQEGYEV